jgi:hypothetical protein
MTMEVINHEGRKVRDERGVGKNHEVKKLTSKEGGPGP